MHRQPSRPRLPAPSNAGVRPSEFRISAGEFRRIAARVERELGIEIRDHKRQMVHSRLARRLRALGLPSFTAYLDHLDSVAGDRERQHFANAVTTNLTSFFREAHHFAHFEAELLHPEPDRAGRLRVWSAGCATGEEPYSLAMILHTRAGALGRRDIRVLATDLDTEALAAAGRGRFAPERLGGVPARFRGPDFLQSGSGGFAVAEPVSRLVTFRALNLVAPWPMRGPFDAIFSRNVLIYFAAGAKAAVIDRLARSLRPGGVLYLGHSESLLGAHPELISEGRTIYRRTGR